MFKYHGIGRILCFLYVLHIKAEELEMWDNQGSVFSPSILQKKDTFRPAISNLDDLKTETVELHAKFGYVHPSLLSEYKPKEYSANQQIGYLYNPALNIPLGYKKKNIGYDSDLGFGSEYKKVVFSVYHLTESKNSPIVFLANNRSLVRHFVSSEYGRDKLNLERIPGLLNNNNQIQVNVGPINSRAFDLLGISAFFKDSVSKQKWIRLSKEHRESQEFAIRSKITGKYIAAVGNNTKAQFKTMDECEEEPKTCIFIWIPYKE